MAQGDGVRQGVAAAQANEAAANPYQAPQLQLPKAGGAIRGIGEKFAANPVTGTGTASIPIATSPGRSGFGPTLALSYDSGAGNGPFGLGWVLSLGSITRRTDKGLPRYDDEPADGEQESDVFVLHGAEDLVPVLREDTAGRLQPMVDEREGFRVARYRPRVEGLFSRIERWTCLADGASHWRVTDRGNVTSCYGLDAASRIADPADPRRVFSWLLASSQDDRGNRIEYLYQAEDDAGIDPAQAHERNRTEGERRANRYLKRVRYGNTVPCGLVDVGRPQHWLFEVVFDYGEGYLHTLPADAEGREFVDVTTEARQPWGRRRDPFSTCRPGFELRTARLCRRVLMFHHFERQLGAADYLVRATEFAYEEGAHLSFMRAVRQSSYVRQADGCYLQRSLPQVEFEYSGASLGQVIHEVDPASLANLPADVDGLNYRWVDLDSEGLSGILAEQAGHWFYKRNRSPLGLGGEGGAQFAAATEVAPLPAIAVSQRHQFLDLAGSGRLDCVMLERPLAGFYRRSDDEGWTEFRSLAQQPVIDWGNPNLRFVDLNGDGRTDVLVTEQDVYTWYPSLAEDGFGTPRRLSSALDEDDGPAVIFSDGSETLFLADMTGDGLSDIVRIRNGEVCYWANLGYGRFGRKVTMDDSPWFETIDRFDPHRIRLGDVDGSGTTDIVYLGDEACRIYFNQAGNSWSGGRQLPGFPMADSRASVQLVDLLGAGTACLVWSTPLPSRQGRSLRYIELMAEGKPHLLTLSRNNLGAETRIRYAPSTKFYLVDQAAGRPWLTRLPFPVQVVETVEQYDLVSRNRFTSRYRYHHGYYDGREREFRGFGMVEQQDCEEIGILAQQGRLGDASNLDATSYVPPSLSKTWFHLGTTAGGRITRGYEHEYWHEPGLDETARAALSLPDSVLPEGLADDEYWEAIRSLKGAVLRQETYTLDGGPAAERPYTVSESNYAVLRLQGIGPNRHAVFFTYARESLTGHYERKLYPAPRYPGDLRQLADPRVMHSMVIAADDYGNVLRSVAIGYGRRLRATDPDFTEADHQAQARLQTVLSENRYTQAIDDARCHRTPLPADSSTYELLELQPRGECAGFVPLFRFGELAQALAEGSGCVPPVRRLLSRARTLYRSDDLARPLPIGCLETLALPYAQYRLALTPVELAALSKGGQPLLDDVERVLREDGGYASGEELCARRLFPADDPAGQWWKPSGRIFYSSEADATPAQESATARRHFFLPLRYQSPFGHPTLVRYDEYDLLALESQDALGNRSTVGERMPDDRIVNGNDYRVLAPASLTDPNGNRTQVAFDCLGLVAGSAIMGKCGEQLGDSLEGFVADLCQTQVDRFYDDPRGDVAGELLAGATLRSVYDVDRWRRQGLPAYVAGISREVHLSEQGEGEGSRRQVSISYSDGFAREIQKRAQAEAGPLVEQGASVLARWICSGWTILNNKGKAVRQYEPFFTDSHAYVFGAVTGRSPTLFYDALDRVVATLHADQSWEKVVFDAWQQQGYDPNDTVLLDPATDPDVGELFRRLVEADYRPGWYTLRAGGAMGNAEQDAAHKAAAHAATPTATIYDALGRAYISISDNGTDDDGYRKRLFSRTILDVQGRQLAVVDALGRTVMHYVYDLTGTRLVQASMEGGERWMLNDVAGAPIRGWNSRDFAVRTTYDALRRPLAIYLREGGGDEAMVGRTEYGESLGDDPAMHNLRGQVVRVCDQAGEVLIDRYDLHGKAIRSTRRLAVEYKARLDWRGDVALELERWQSENRFDALGRPVEVATPDGGCLRLAYNEAGLLERLDARSGSGEEWACFVVGVDYDAQGRRRRIDYGNGSICSYEYDADSLRLMRVLLRRPHGQAWQALQDLHYCYDAAGNITRIADHALPDVYFRNRCVQAGADYTYDAVYRLVQAHGREHLAGAAGAGDLGRIGLPLPGDGMALTAYVERYVYDAVGNMLDLHHHGSDPSLAGWSRHYEYGETSQIEAGRFSNRLSATRIGQQVEHYRYDGTAGRHGDMSSMPQLALMQWDHRDQLQASARSAGGDITWYVYDAGGNRVRKITESVASGTLPRRRHERIYVGGIECYRAYHPDGSVSLERQTLQVMDGKRRVAMVETRTVGDDGTPMQVRRYQHGNQIGSACLELDGHARILSYEEYYPYGATAYQGVAQQLEAPKRYRFSGMERDEETGLDYHGARYYAPWLGRWTSADPTGLVDGPNLYRYARNDPVALQDPGGGDTPDPFNFATFDSFRDASPRVYTEEYLQSQWEAVHGPVAVATPRSISYSTARSEANAGARAYRDANGMTGATVQAGHTVAARHTDISGISDESANAPETFMQLCSRHGQGLEVTIDGSPNPYTVHNAQETIIDACVDRVMEANGDVLTPEGHQASGAEVRWILQGTGFDQREVDIKRASGLFDEQAAIDASPAVQAYRASRAGGVCTPSDPDGTGLPPAGEGMGEPMSFGRPGMMGFSGAMNIFFSYRDPNETRSYFGMAAGGSELIGAGLLFRAGQTGSEGMALFGEGFGTAGSAIMAPVILSQSYDQMQSDDEYTRFHGSIQALTVIPGPGTGLGAVLIYNDVFVQPAAETFYDIARRDIIQMTGLPASIVY